MKTLFVGPSLFGSQIDLSGLDVRPPAAQGDVYRAVQQGGTHIGLIDGVFGDSGSVWHKELLFALAQGVQVFGEASMGALRAAECAAFGVVPVGTIALAYTAGILDDDADVALTHAPEAFGWQPFTIPLVDVRATIEVCVSKELADCYAGELAVEIASRIPFSARTEVTLADQFAAVLGLSFSEVFMANRTSQKRADAEELVSILRRAQVAETERSWTFNASPMWKTFTSTHA